MVVDDFLQGHPDFELIPVCEDVRLYTSDGIGYDGCKCQNLYDARRFYPHKSRGEGQFMAVLHNKHTPVARSPITQKSAVKIDPIVIDFLNDTLVDYDLSQVSMYNGNPVYASPALTLDKGVAFSCGVTIGEIRKNYIQPHHQFLMAMGQQNDLRWSP